MGKWQIKTERSGEGRMRGNRDPAQLRGGAPGRAGEPRAHAHLLPQCPWRRGGGGGGGQRAVGRGKESTGRGRPPGESNGIIPHKKYASPRKPMKAGKERVRLVANVRVKSLRSPHIFFHCSPF